MRASACDMFLQFCDYRTNQRWKVAQHELCHNAEDKPFACRFCTFRSAVKCVLSKHESTHTGVRTYGCRYCEYRTTDKFDLSNHQSTLHTGTGRDAMWVVKYRRHCRGQLSSLGATQPHSRAYSHICTHTRGDTDTLGTYAHRHRHAHVSPLSC